MEAKIKAILILVIGLYLAAASTASARDNGRRNVRRSVVPSRRVITTLKVVPNLAATPRPATPQTLRARPAPQQAAMGFGGAAVSDGTCKTHYIRCLEMCGVRGNSSDCTSSCGMKCLTCDFKRTGRTDASSSSCRR